MLSNNLKSLRRSKGFSQEELAAKLNVVRQTISKWEQGLSVPDSEMLIRIAAVLDTSVTVLLGETMASEDNYEINTVAAKLELLNEEFANRIEKRRKIWRRLFIGIGIVSFIILLQMVIGFIHFQIITNDIQSNSSIIGGADGPTSILATTAFVKYDSMITAIIGAIVSVVGFGKTKRR